MAKKILIVDDEKDIVTILKKSVEKAGYEAFEAYDGISALEIIDRVKFDLIVLDIMMPKFDGNSVNMSLKSKPETASIPVIIITGKGIGLPKEVKNIVEDLKVSGYIEKPFSVSVLVKKIHEILG